MLDADRAGIARYEQDGESVVVVGGGGEDEDVVKWPAGTRRNGVELLALVRSARPELAVIDIRMPAESEPATW